MRVGFFHSTKSWCVEFVEQFKQGAREHGDVIEPVDLDAPFSMHWDAACILGIGYISTWDRVQKAPMPMCYLDKGFTRTGDYFYTSIGEYRPINYVGHWLKPGDRREQFGWNPKPWRTDGNHVLVAGSSFKYHQFHRLPPPPEWRDVIVKRLQEYTYRPILFRPKPNQPMEDRWFHHDDTWVEANRRSIEHDLKDCWAVVVHSSSVCLDALLAGIPTIVLGQAVTRPISSQSLSEIEQPKLANLADTNQLLSDLAYSQWSLQEYADGTAWATIKPALNKLVYLHSLNKPQPASFKD